LPAPGGIDPPPPPLRDPGHARTTGVNNGGAVTTAKADHQGPTARRRFDILEAVADLRGGTAKIYYGAPAGQPSAVTLQAIKGASLIVRGADGLESISARQFAPGEGLPAAAGG